MNIIKVKNYEEMSQIAATTIIQTVHANPSATLGLATGSTPKGVYLRLIEDFQEKGTTYQNIRTVNLDEYIGLDEASEQSYFHFMKTQLFNHIDIPADQTYIPSGTSHNWEKECSRYEEQIKKLGGVQLQLLGIGNNGHIGFNEPGTSFSSRTHVVELAESTRKANSRFFSSIENVPTHAITMGISTILDSEEILLLASGASKAKAIQELLHGEMTEQFPASSLKSHKHVTIIADEEALQLVDL
ncbi:glucosamine-6-phosphate deaminase [Cytobacillus spongiae]|uniref:glucosamine-6-phosphate deaminase n=1 Tax=Cytobacillus spongiae TaxID=2901381 RepID=UPI001F39953F|nr:glucosamine-6-phosphate deaminase [Cytobacillus spongiae]UII57987.1 glucosamine-6-phosphate deaminase [Cytobacillus spongiae]